MSPPTLSIKKKKIKNKKQEKFFVLAYKYTGRIVLFVQNTVLSFARVTVGNFIFI